MDEQHMELQARLEEFEKLVNKHDLFYSYSDDHSVYRRGYDQEIKIMELAKELPRENVVAIWNKMIDRSMIPELTSAYYWRV